MKNSIKPVVLLVVLSIAIVSCNNDDDAVTPPVTNTIKNTTFIHALAQSQEECNAALAQGVNCSQWIEFKESTAQFVITDIINSGNYVVVENKITVSFDEGAEVISELVFEIAEDYKSVTLITNDANLVFKRNRDGVDPWDL